MYIVHCSQSKYVAICYGYSHSKYIRANICDYNSTVLCEDNPFDDGKNINNTILSCVQNIFCFKKTLFSGDSLSYHAGQKFSTIDMDNDEWKDGACAIEHGGAWWYKECDKRYSNKPIYQNM